VAGNATIASIDRSRRRLLQTGADSQVDLAIPDGQVVTAANAKPALPVIVNFNGRSPEVL